MSLAEELASNEMSEYLHLVLKDHPHLALALALAQA